MGEHGGFFLPSRRMQQRQASPFVAYAPHKLHPFEDFMLGGVAAAISKTAAAPIERIKLMVQNQDEMIKAGRLSTPYNGVMDCFRRTIADEGIVSLWRGNTANVLRYFPTQALNFAFKDKIKSMFNKSKEKDGQLAVFMANIASGGCAGALSLLFVYSLDYARIRLANDAKAAKKAGEGAGERQFNGLLDVYKKTYASDGVAGLYRGFMVSCAGIIVYRGCYFGIYDTVKPILLTGEKANNFIYSFIIGYAVKYSSSFQCAAQIMRQEGLKSFFKGVGANI